MTQLYSQKGVDNSTCGLMAEGEAIYVEGIGYIGQYHSYIDLWEKGLPCFVRDDYYNEIQMRLEAGSKPKDVRPLVAELNALNSDIVEYEKFIGLDEWRRRHQSTPNPPPSPARTQNASPRGQTM
eukprot:1588747-Prymnesium_polylepis.1